MNDTTHEARDRGRRRLLGCPVCGTPVRLREMIRDGNPPCTIDDMLAVCERCSKAWNRDGWERSRAYAEFEGETFLIRDLFEDPPLFPDDAS